MQNVDRSVRARAFIQRRFWLLVVVLCVAVVATGWWAVTVHITGPGMQQVTVDRDDWRENTTFDHRAEIVRDTLIWNATETVHNRPLYYVNLSPRLDGTYHYQFEDAESGQLTVDTDVRLVIRAVDEEAVFWEYARPLAAESSDTVDSETTHSVDFTIDIERVLETIARIEEQLAASEGLIDVRVEVTSVVDGQVQGRLDQDELDNEVRESSLQVVVSPDTYRVRQPETVSTSHRHEITEQRPVETPMTDAIGSIGSFNLTLLLLLALIAGQVTGRLDINPEEEELLQLERDREQFDDWISTGTFPADRDFDATVLVDELVGLVDVAIDTNNRVIEDQQLGVSAVMDNETVYVYVHPDSPARDWLINYADTTLDEFDRGMT